MEIKVMHQVGLLDWNFEELKAQLTVGLAKYNDLVITEEQVKEAKSMRAELNKLKSAINDKKLMVKKDYCAPYLEFEAQAKELINMVTDVNLKIDEQIKKFESIEKENKQKEIQAFYEQVGFILVPFEKIFDSKWLNKTCSEQTWKAELSSKVENIKVNLAIINNLEGTDEDKQKIKVNYLDSLDLENAIQKHNRDKKMVEILNAASQEVVIINQTSNKQNIEEHVEQEQLYTRTFKVIDATREQIIALGDYMNKNGIKFAKIEQ